MSDLRMRPKLVVDGADRAITFYGEVFGATVVSRYTMGESVVFAELTLPSGDVLQLKDPDAVDTVPADGGTGVVMDVLCDDPDAVARAALDRGAELVFPVADQPYGSRQGRVRDPFGHQWIVGTAVSRTDAEVQRALDEWADRADG